MTRCVDCIAEGISTDRPIYSGTRKPRCRTHHRRAHRRSQSNAHGRMLVSTYGLTSEEYATLYAAQGGRCAICQRATGKTKRLAVDHNHACTAGHPPDKACSRCWRGLLCYNCNVYLIGRYNIEALLRAINYLHDPPAQKLRREFATEEGNSTG